MQGGFSSIESFTQTVIVVIGVQVLGYVCKRAGVITRQGETGITVYLSNVGLPALLFRQIATLEWQSLDWRLLTAIVGAKGAIFTASSAATHAFPHTVHSARNCGVASQVSCVPSQSVSACS